MLHELKVNKGAVQTLKVGNRDTLTVGGSKPQTLVGGAQGPSYADVISGAGSKSVPVDADQMVLLDSAALWQPRKVTFGDFRTWVWNPTFTWNDAAQTFTALKLNVTDTASAAASKLLDLQVGGASKFNVDKTGKTVGASFELSGGGGGRGKLTYNSSTDGLSFWGGAAEVAATSNGGIILGPAKGLVWSSNAGALGNFDAGFWRDTANTLALRNGVNAQTLRIYGSYTDSLNYSRAFFQWSNGLLIGTEGAGTGNAGAAIKVISGAGASLSLGAGGSGRWAINTSGHLTPDSIDNTYDFGSAAVRPRNGYFGSELHVNHAGSVTQGVASLTVWGSSLDNNYGGFIKLRSQNGVNTGGIGVTNGGLYLFNATGTPFTKSVRITDSFVACIEDNIFDLGVNTTGRWRHAYLAGNVYADKFVVGAGGSGRSAISDDGFDISNALAISNGTNPQTFRVYGTKTDGANYERFVLKLVNSGSWPGFTLTTEAAGTGVARDLVLASASGWVGSPGNVRVGQGSTNSVLQMRTIATVAGSGSGTISWFSSDPVPIGQIAGYTSGYVSSVAGISVASSIVLQSMIAGGGLHLHTNAGDIVFSTDNVAPKWTLQAAGHFMAGVDNAYDIGASAANRPRNIYVGSSLVTNSVSIGSGGQITGNGNGLGFNYAAFTAGVGLTLGLNRTIGWAGNDNAFNSQDTAIVRDGTPGTVALRLGATPHALRVYNTYTDSLNYERFGAEWAANILLLTTSNAGTGVLRGMRINAASIDFQASGSTRWSVTGAGAFVAGVDNTYDFGSATLRPRTGYFGTSVVAPTILVRGANSAGFYSPTTDVLAVITATVDRWRWDASGHYFPFSTDTYDLGVATNMIRSVTTGQAGHVTYNSYTDSLNYDRAVFKVSGNYAVLQTEQAGTGVARHLALRVPASTSVYFGPGGTDKWVMSSTGDFSPLTDNVYDLGVASGAGRPRTIRAATSVVIGNDLTFALGTGTATIDTVNARALVLNPSGNPVVVGSGASAALRFASATGLGLFAPTSSGLELRNGTQGMAFNVYNTYTDSANYELARITWNANVLIFGTAQAGTGVSRDVQIRTQGGGVVSLYTNGTERWTVGGTTGNLVPGATNTYDIGSGANRVRAVVAQQVSASQWIAATPVTYASLPTPASVGDGVRAFITDSTVAFSGANLGTAVAGGGVEKTPVITLSGQWVVG